MADETKSSLWLVRIGCTILLSCLIARGVVSAVVSMYAMIGAAIVALWILLELRLRRDGFGLVRFGVPVLLIGCSCNLVLGRFPGLFLSSLTSTLALVVAIAVISAIASGSIRGFGARFGVALLWSVAGAAWQVGVAPILPMFLIHN